MSAIFPPTADVNEMATNLQSNGPPIPNPHYEALLKMREHNQNAWRILSPQTKYAVQYYEIAKSVYGERQRGS
jgi:hypothetical protein